ncbi:MBL fold metallo-hydrolase [Candidatus Saccharibacteria bacterium]|nr:MBL fold metallo-hydrolase [Candidatus Saccharibacteria bacterium]
MFDIEYKGGNAVIITTKKGSLAIDPKRSIFGLKNIVVKNGIELATEARFLTNSPEYQVNLEGPGEYEVSGFLIYGAPAYRHLDDRTKEGTIMASTLYRVEVDDVNIGVIGNVDPEITDDILETLDNIDVLIIPVGGNGYTLDATAAAAWANKIGPKVIIPVHYQNKALSYEVPQDSVDTFVELMKLPVVDEKKYKLKTAATLPVAAEIHKLELS